MSAIRVVFVNNLKFYRKKIGMSQEKLSHAVGRSIAYINQIENKDTWPQPEMVDKIAEILGIPPSALFREDGCPENKCAKFEEAFGRTLEAELLSRIENTVRNVFGSM